MTWLIFIACTLAVFRLTRLITDDKITDFLRTFVKKEANKLPRKAKQKAKEGITCPFCVSFYISAFITIYLWRTGLIHWKTMFLWGTAMWGGSILLNELVVRLMDKKR
jgi:hypothetical protein